MSRPTATLKEIFKDLKDFAWEVLEWEVRLELAKEVIGEDIASLLSLYMKGVEKLNGAEDPREIYFRNRVTNLMMRPVVVKSLSSPPRDSKVVKSKPAEQQPKPTVTTKLPSEPVKLVIQDFSQKKKELQMRLAYETQDNNTQNLNKMISQHASKSQTVNKFIAVSINDNSQRLQERIKQRQMKASTSRARSEIKQTKNERKKTQANINIEVIKEQQPKSTIKRRKSLEILMDPSESPQRFRRCSYHQQCKPIE